MPRDQFKREPQSGGNVLGRCKQKKVVSENVVVIDTDNAEPDVIIIDAPETSYWGSGCSRRKRVSSASYVIIIDDEDEGIDGGPSTTSYGRFPKESVVEERTQVGRSARNHPGLDNISDSSYSQSLGSGSSEAGTSDAQDTCDSSDCEILEDTSGNIREQWEQAALRRRMTEEVLFDSEDWTSASSSSSSVEIGTQLHENMNDMFNAEGSLNQAHLEQMETEFHEDEGGTDPSLNEAHLEQMETEFGRAEGGPSNMHAEHASSPEMMEQVLESSCHVHQPQQNPVSHGISQEKGMPFVEPKSCFNSQSTDAPNVRNDSQSTDAPNVGNDSQSTDAPNVGNNRDFSQQCGEDCLGNASIPGPEDRPLLPSDLVDIPGKLVPAITGEDSLDLQNGLIGAREKHKESVEYKLAEEEEWASRQRQLQIQAEEAQKLRRRRKAESLRLVDMERRQKQRLEEIREIQRKNEETINLKEQYRVQVRKELEQMERRFYDMASLLRGLGVHVEGGLCPSMCEVKSAYKQALLRFHPDRVSTGDIHQQVKAEETFKFISRVKEKLLPAA